jgi:hypothetical protein
VIDLRERKSLLSYIRPVDGRFLLPGPDGYLRSSSSSSIRLQEPMQETGFERAGLTYLTIRSVCLVQLLERV